MLLSLSFSLIWAHSLGTQTGILVSGSHCIVLVKQLSVDDILFFIDHNVKTPADELNSDLKANLNGHP